MFLKKISRRIKDRKMSKIERRIERSQGDEERNRLLAELMNMKVEIGDIEGAFEAAVERLRLIRSDESFEDFSAIFKKFDRPMRTAATRSLIRLAGEFDEKLWERVMRFFFSEEPDLAIDLATACYRISRRVFFVEVALQNIEMTVASASRERLSKIKEMYMNTIAEVGEISREDQLAILKRIVVSGEMTIRDELLYLELSIMYGLVTSSEEDLREIAERIVERFDGCGYSFKGNEASFLIRLDQILSRIDRFEDKKALLEKIRLLDKSVPESVNEICSDESNDIELIKKRISVSESRSKNRNASREDLEELARDYERLIEILQLPEDKLVYIRKLGVLLRDRLEEHHKALEIFEKGLRLRGDDVSLWLVKGMTLEKIAKTEREPDRASLYWKMAYNHYHAIAETFEEQEIKLAAIEKCAMIQSERLTKI